MHTLHEDIKIPAYQVTINTTALNCKVGCLKERLQKEYLHQYWRRFKMDQKRIIPSCEDRLSELTTTQIDMIIDNEKMQNLLYSNKQKIPPISFHHDKSKPNTHSNIYQANFIAKINEIAIKRQIHYIPLEGMDDDSTKIDANEKAKAKRKPYKYSKEYKGKAGPIKMKTEGNEDDEVKSIESFQGNLQQFQIKLDVIKKSKDFNGKKAPPSSNRRQSFKLIPENRWFYGMSTYYLQQQKPNTQTKMRETWKHCYDISSELRPNVKPRSRSSFSTNATRLQTNHRPSTSKTAEPFHKFKINRVVDLHQKP